MARTCPGSALTSLEYGFQALVRPPAELTLDCRGLAGLPSAVLPLDRLRDLLIDERRIGRAVGDSVWRALIVRERRGDHGARVAVAGMAVPALSGSVRALRRRWVGEVADLERELLVGFLTRLSSIHLDMDGLGDALVAAARRAVMRSERWLPHAAAGGGSTVAACGGCRSPRPGVDRPATSGRRGASR